MADEYSANLEALKKKFGQCKEFRSRLESDWYLNLSYYMGDQWIFWNRSRIDRPILEEWRVMFVDNRILPSVVARVAKATKNRPTFVCTPKTADESDMHNAEIGEKVLTNDWETLNLDEKHLLAQFWKEICGAGFWKIYWDRTKGNSAEFLHGPNGQPMMKPESKAPYKKGTPEAETAQNVLGQQKQDYSYQEIASGDLMIDVMSPFELFPDPLAKSLDECEYIFEEKIRSKEYLLKQYGKAAEGLIEDADIPIGIAESRMFSSQSATGKSQAKGVRVWEYYCRPNTKDPNGKWCVFTNTKILKESDGPDSPFGPFPYVMFVSNLVPGRFWPTAITSHLRGPQTDLNKLQSQIRENAIRIGNPAVLISREADVEWKGGIGEKVLFSDTVQNALPSFLQPPEIPNYVRQEVERIENTFKEISGLHDISNAQVPAGITAASAINLLQEADDTRLGPEIQLMERTLAIAGEYMLKLRAKYTNEQRVARMAGKDGGWDIFSWKGEILENIIGVSVQAGSGMPHSKAARQAAMQELLNLALQYGVPLNQRSMRKFFQDYEMGGLDKLFQDLENDEGQITRENRKLYNGEMFGINDYDDDDLHIEGHEEEMKTAKFEQTDPQTQGRFIAHWKMHKERRTQAVQEQVAAQGQEQQQQQEAQQHQDLEQILAKEAAKEGAEAS